MRKKTKYHNADGIVQVLKIRKKAWIALRLHLANIFNLLAGTWRRETRHQSTPPAHSLSKKKKKTKQRRGKVTQKFVWSHYLAKKNTLVSITADAAPSRSRIFKGLLANASAVTDDKENVFAYAATDEKENDHYWSRAHLPGAELALLAFASAATDNKDADRSVLWIATSLAPWELLDRPHKLFYKRVSDWRNCVRIRVLQLVHVEKKQILFQNSGRRITSAGSQGL